MSSLGPRSKNLKDSLSPSLFFMNFGENKTIIMGILNVTPDSFSDGGVFFDDVEKVIEQARQMVLDGADILDIGGESTRPGSDPVSVEEELRRVIPVIDRLLAEVTVKISIDTYKPEVARACLERGVHILNDITGLRSGEMREIAARYGVPVVIMHMQGMPKTMQQEPVYEDVVEDIKIFFREQILLAQAAGVKEIILDPGIGFGKTLGHNLEILRDLKEFTEFGFPVLVGPSRKAFIGKLTGDAVASDRLEGTLASVVVSAMNGASILRVHDIKECRRALNIVDAMKNI